MGDRGSRGRNGILPCFVAVSLMWWVVVDDDGDDGDNGDDGDYGDDGDDI